MHPADHHRARVANLPGPDGHRHTLTRPAESVGGERRGTTLAETLDRIAPPCLTRLVAPAALDRVRGVLRWLPAPLSSWIYLECRIAAGATRTDVIAKVDQRGRSVLAGTNPALELSPALRAHPVWASAGAFAREWARPGSLLRAAVERCWLEFDVGANEPGEPGPDDVRGPVPVPALFVDFRRDLCAEPSIDRRLAAAAAALEWLRGAPVPAATIRLVRRCLALLPRGADLPSVGVFPMRDAGVVRACVRGLADDALAPLLRALAWPGDAGEVAALIAPLAGMSPAPGASAGIIDLDLTDVLQSRIGLEYMLARRSQERGTAGVPPLLDRLVARGLCAPDKRDALLAWPGEDRGTLAHELWPSRLARRVNHIKVVWQPGMAPEVKAYLCAYHQFVGTRHSALGGGPPKAGAWLRRPMHDARCTGKVAQGRSPGDQPPSAECRVPNPA